MFFFTEPLAVYPFDWDTLQDGEKSGVRWKKVAGLRPFGGLLQLH